MLRLPRLYPILDAEVLAQAGLALDEAAAGLREAGVSWVQYRDKRGSDAEVVAAMRRLRTHFPRGEATLLLNDRAHLCGAADADGVHLGQQDMSVADARRMLGAAAVLGLSTHNEAQLAAALAASELNGEPNGELNYVAIGPVFGTTSKQNPDPVVGLAGVATALGLTTLPLVAIGGITAANARSILDRGADSVAMISALLPATGQTVAQRLRDILQLLR